MFEKVARTLAVPATTALMVGLLATPALSRRADEVIDIYDCSPGYTKVGDGPDYICVSDEPPATSWPTSAPPAGGGGKSMPQCPDCDAAFDDCQDVARASQGKCYEGMNKFFEYQCSHFTKDVFGNPLNPRKYSCSREKTEKGETRVCLGPDVYGCMLEATDGASYARIGQQIGTSGAALEAKVAADPSLKLTISQQVTNVTNYNVFEGVNASCTKIAADMALQCTQEYQTCGHDVAAKKRNGQCR